MEREGTGPGQWCPRAVRRYGTPASPERLKVVDCNTAGRRSWRRRRRRGPTRDGRGRKCSKRWSNTPANARRVGAVAAACWRIASLRTVAETWATCRRRRGLAAPSSKSRTPPGARLTRRGRGAWDRWLDRRWWRACAAERNELVLRMGTGKPAARRTPSSKALGELSISVASRRAGREARPS